MAFITYDVSLDLIRSLRDIVPIIKKYDKDLAEQIHRAASSVTLNLGEGARSTAGNQRARYESAHGSANEVKAALQVAASWGWVDDLAPQLAILDRLLALLWKLTNGCGRGATRTTRAR